MTLRDSLKELCERHKENMKNPVYAYSFALMQEASKPIERNRHYDRDGYCDSPYRGY